MKVQRLGACPRRPGLPERPELRAAKERQKNE
jgi:hypothetical protein